MSVHYFGYGAMANPAIMEALLGRLPKRNRQGGNPRLEGWSLVVQNLDHLPDIPKVHNGVEINPQARMRQEWGDDFLSYTIVPNPDGTVCGVVWEYLTHRERELLREWELIPWGWFKDLPEVSIRTSGYVYCCTESIGDGQYYDREIGFITETNPPLLMPEADVIAQANKVNKEFFSR